MKLSREQAQALAAQRLKAKRRSTRRKSSLVLSMSAAAMLVPFALFAGWDFSGALYPGDERADAEAPLAVGAGDHVVLELEGALDNGTLFLPNGTVDATLGTGELVPGLERALLGLAPGDSFDVIVAPADGYGNWTRSRTYHVAPLEHIGRNRTMEVGNYDDVWGTPRVGDTAPTTPWNSTVAVVGTKYVTLQYAATVNSTVRYHKYWDSRVVAQNNSTIVIENLLYVGYTYTRTSNGATLTYRLTTVDSRGFLFDRNPPLAGETLHYRGRVVSVEPGAASVTLTGRPVSMGASQCSRCHGGFSALDAGATASREGAGVRVNLTVSNPWRHDLRGIRVEATSLEANVSLASDAAPVADLAPAGSSELSVLLVEAPAAEGVVRVVVNATAVHVHRSPGRHDENAYQLAFEVPVGGPGRAAAAAPAASGQTAAEFWGLVGQWAGAAALAALCLPATQGLRRHAGLKPRFKWPPWLDAHFSVSVVAVAASLVHGVALMSTTYHGAWTWDVWAGVAGLALLATLGITGVVLAKWTPVKWARVKRVHYVLLVGLLFAGALHLVASSTTLRWLVGG